MQKYEEYKESGIEWIGEIPTDWNVMRLRYRGKSIIGITYKPEQVVSNKEDGILVLRSSNVQNGKLDFKDNVYVNKEINENQLTKEGDILVCARNGSAHLVGKSAYIPKEWENVTFGAFMSIVRTDLDKFLFYYFNSQVFKGQKGLFATSTINQLTSNMLNNLDIPVPPTKSQQTTISNYLDRKTAEIDKLLSEKKALAELYKEEKTAIINQVITKGVNPDATMKDSGIEWLGKVPKHWEVKKLKYVAKMLSGNAFSSQDFCESGIQLIKISNLYNNHLSLDRQPTFLPLEYENKYQNWIVTNGDILMSMTGTLGKRDYGFAILISNTKNKFLLNQRVSKLHSYSDVTSKLFLSILRSEYFLNNLFSKPSGTKQGNFSNEDVLNLKLAYPMSDNEQSQIVQYIEKESQRIDKKISKAEKYITLLTEYRTALISEVVTGKIKVTNEI